MVVSDCRADPLRRWRASPSWSDVLGANAGGIYGAGHHAASKADAPKIAAAQAQNLTAQAQVAVTTSATGAAEHTRSCEAALTTQAEEAAHAVQSAPGADAPLPPDVLREWRAGIDGLRQPADGGGAAPASGADALRQPCPRPARPDAPTAGELAMFSLRQEAAIGVCESRKDEALGVIDAGNEALTALAKGKR